MGQVSALCGDNLFKQLQSEYGENFAKFILAEKSKQIVGEKFTEINHQSQDLFSDF